MRAILGVCLFIVAFVLTISFLQFLFESPAITWNRNILSGIATGLLMYWFAFREQ